MTDYKGFKSYINTNNMVAGAEVERVWRNIRTAEDKYDLALVSFEYNKEQAVQQILSHASNWELTDGTHPKADNIDVSRDSNIELFVREY